MVKPGQEKRVDLPTIGLRTVELAAKAGLAGIVTEGGQSFVPIAGGGHRRRRTRRGYSSRAYLRRHRKLPKHVYIVAVESSGDHLGAGLIEALLAQSPNLQISAIGGKAMNGRGVGSALDITGLSILGFSEALRAYPLVRRRVREAVALILAARPDAVVLIDSWGFMIRVAQGLKRAGFVGQIVKYVAPQVWAMREGRSAILAKSIDHLLSIHSFDAPYFEKHGLRVTHVGNPMFDTDLGGGDETALRARYWARGYWSESGQPDLRSVLWLAAIGVRAIAGADNVGRENFSGALSRYGLC